MLHDNFLIEWDKFFLNNWLEKREFKGAGVCRFWLLFSDSVKILHGREFWGVDKLKSAANFCK